MAKTATPGATPIEALLREKRKFPPPKDFVRHANVNTPSIYKDAAKNPARFWERFARELHWFKPWRKALEWKVPYAPGTLETKGYDEGGNCRATSEKLEKDGVAALTR